MTEFINVSSHAEDLANGRVVEPREKVSLTEKELKEPHNRRLTEDGVFIEVNKNNGKGEAK